MVGEDGGREFASGNLPINIAARQLVGEFARGKPLQPQTGAGVVIGGFAADTFRLADADFRNTGITPGTGAFFVWYDAAEYDSSYA